VARRIGINAVSFRAGHMGWCRGASGFATELLFFCLLRLNAGAFHAAKANETTFPFGYLDGTADGKCAE